MSNLTPGRGTAIGGGITQAIAAIAEGNPAIAPLGAEVMPVDEDEYAAEIIVVLTDGVTTIGTPPLDAAVEAAARGVRVYTIGFGTENGAQFSRQCSGPSGMGPGGFSGGASSAGAVSGAAALGAAASGAGSTRRPSWRSPS